MISKDYNKIDATHNASAHAELLTVQKCGRLFSTLEPCTMCLSAALAFRVDRVVYGARDYKLGA